MTKTTINNLHACETDTERWIWLMDTTVEIEATVVINIPKKNMYISLPHDDIVEFDSCIVPDDATLILLDALCIDVNILRGRT